ncbi:uncharacterized protein LOC111633012 [Centruroides sculpturatus]|uniref:uncharacterized protein LOC111633012 n=1 Tax=Centruroides sculpturatus TaxID=218467 RepID=UPI000C6D4597|nr:uncharacterized protein LOC111633012 [Centruroides sculpturatus]
MKVKGRRTNNRIEALIKEREILDNLKEELKKEGKRAKPDIKENAFMNRLQEKKRINGMKKKIEKTMPESTERKVKSPIEDERHQDKSKSEGLRDPNYMKKSPSEKTEDDGRFISYYYYCCDFCYGLYGYDYVFENEGEEFVSLYNDCLYNCFNYWCYYDYDDMNQYYG